LATAKQQKSVKKNFIYLFIYLFIVGLAYPGKGIVFRFIIEYSSLRDFYRPLGNNNNNNNNNRSIFFNMRIFETW
jgi:hypothetical protein